MGICGSAETGDPKFEFAKMSFFEHYSQLYGEKTFKHVSKTVKVIEAVVFIRQLQNGCH